jgi:hypothetical protein
MVLEALGPGQIEFKVHGLTSEDHGQVPARVFANKLKQLVSALEAADRIANGISVHAYVLANMHMSEPTALLKEVRIENLTGNLDSAIPIFHEAIEGIKTHDARTERLAPVIRHVQFLSSGASSKFGFAEVRSSNSSIVRIDDFLQKRTSAIRKSAASKWFNGAVFSTFDGVLDYVDVRGSLPQIKLTLSAGGKELDCICRREDIDVLGTQLHQRVRISGRAIYAGTSPLPIRVEVTSVEPVGGSGDFSRWKGAFTTFEPQPWEFDA